MHFKLLVKDGAVRAVAELPNGVGGEYLRKLREQATRVRERQTKARALSMQVHKLFSPLEEDVICKRTDSGGMLIDFAHLIDSTSHRQIPEPLQRCDPALQGLPDHHYRTVAALSLHAGQAADGLRRQLTLLRKAKEAAEPAVLLPAGNQFASQPEIFRRECSNSPSLGLQSPLTNQWYISFDLMNA